MKIKLINSNGMTREFNIAGLCNPQLHYMADISGKITRIFQLVQ